MLLTTAFAGLGFEVIHHPNHDGSNGPDLWVKKANGRPLSVEIKKARKGSNGTWQVDPVQKLRQRDDLIAIICSSQYVLIHPMEEHLKLCSPKGTRQMTLLLGANP